MPRDFNWSDYEASQEQAAFQRWADEFLNELQARVDYARACLRQERGTDETPYQALQGIKNFVLDTEKGIPE